MGRARDGSQIVATTTRQKTLSSVNDDNRGPRNEPKAFASVMDDSIIREDGVDIPTFLQPFFGMDFVPYNPNQPNASGNLGRESLVHSGTIVGSKQSFDYDYKKEKEDEDDDDIDVLFIKAMNSKKNIKAGLLKRIKGRLKQQARSSSPSDVSIDVVIPNGEENLTNDFMQELGLQRTESDFLDMDDNSIIYENDQTFDGIAKSLKKKQSLITAAGVITGSSRQLMTPKVNNTTNHQNGGDIEFDDLLIAVNNKKQIKAGLLKRFSRGRKKKRTLSWTGTTSSSLGSTTKVTQRSLKRFWSRSGSEVGSDLGGSSNHTSFADTGTDDKTNTLRLIKTQQGTIQNHQTELKQILEQVKVMEGRTVKISKSINNLQGEILTLQKALEKAEEQLKLDLDDFEAAQLELVRLQTVAKQASEAGLESLRKIQGGSHHQKGNGILPQPPLDLSGHEEENPKRLINSGSFMRSHDFELELPDTLNWDQSMTASISSKNENNIVNREFITVDDNVTGIVRNLADIGFSFVTDESERFVPTRDTERTLGRYKAEVAVVVGNDGGDTSSLIKGDWPIKSWQVPRGDDVLVWLGKVESGFGSNWPVCKARGRINLPPRKLVEFMMDSTRVKEYNAMSQGRDDLVIIQESLDTTAEESDYGFPGQCKIVRSRNKPKLIPKAVEITSLLYAKPLDSSVAPPESYLIVNRSTHGDTTGELKSTREVLTSEMILGVNLIRPVDDDHQVSEFSSVTHIYSPGVPAMLARKAAPGSAINMIKDIQKLFDP